MLLNVLFGFSIPYYNSSVFRRALIGTVNCQSNGYAFIAEIAVKLLVNGATIVQDLGPTGFSSTGTYNLSYVVNTATGSISDLVFNGSSIAVSATTIFTDAATTYAGFYQRPNGTQTTPGFADNFTLAAVPEPATLWLASAGLVGLGLAVRRRRMSLGQMAVKRG